MIWILAAIAVLLLALVAVLAAGLRRVHRNLAGIHAILYITLPQGAKVNATLLTEQFVKGYAEARE